MHHRQNCYSVLQHIATASTKCNCYSVINIVVTEWYIVATACNGIICYTVIQIIATVLRISLLQCITVRIATVFYNTLLQRQQSIIATALLISLLPSVISLLQRITYNVIICYTVIQIITTVLRISLLQCLYVRAITRKLLISLLLYGVISLL